MKRFRLSPFSSNQINTAQLHRDVVYFFQNGLWTLAGQIAVSVAALVMTVAISRALSPVDYGIYRYVMTLIPVFLLATLPNMGNAVTVAIAQQKEVNISGALRAKIRWGFLATGVGILMALYYYFTQQPLLAITIGFAALCIPFFDTFSLYKFILQGKHDFKTAAIYQSLNRIIAATCVVVVIFFTRNVVVLIATILLSQIVSQWYFWHKTTTHIPKSISNIDVTSYGKHLSILGILTTIGAQIDKLLVWFLFGPVSLAVYSIILAIPLEGTRLLESLAAIVLPRFSTIQWDNHEKRLFVVKRILLISLPMFLGAGLYILLAERLFSILFPAYLSHVFLSQLASLVIITVPLGDLAAQAFIAWGKIKTLIWVACIEIVILLVGMFFAAQLTSLPFALFTLITKELFVFLALILALALPPRTSHT